MSGQRVTPQQAKVYMTLRKTGIKQAISAAKAGFSERTGRNIERRGIASCKVQSKRAKRINDPLEKTWETELVPLLEQVPHLTSLTLLEYLQDYYPGKYPDSILRTIQRRVSKWKALYGPEKEIIFRQIHAPGSQSLSDFTTLKGIEITIKDQTLKHILYHFRLAYSDWSFIKVIQGGESFTALSESLQDALQKLGGCPHEHRTDSLSAAFKNLSPEVEEDITKAYESVCSHYGMIATRNNRGKGHENGSIEAAHGHLKRRLEQALLLRGSYDFESIEDYQNFIEVVVQKHNKRHEAQLYIERPHLQALPDRRTIDFTETIARVATSSTISVKKVMYSVPSRLIGHQLKIHIYDSHLSCYLGADHVLKLPRIRNEQDGKSTRARCINYRHLINSLVKKPGAFRGSILRDDILPNQIYRDIWYLIDRHCKPAAHANKLMVGILKLAADYDCEKELGEFVLSSVKRGKVPCLGSLQARYQLYGTSPSLPPCVDIRQHSLREYDHLLSVSMGGSHARC